MTAEEAIKDIQEIRLLKIFGKYRTPAFDMAISALDKQIAKKRIDIGYEAKETFMTIPITRKYRDLRCPNTKCLNVLIESFNYCPNCGQAICREE